MTDLMWEKISKFLSIHEEALKIDCDYTNGGHGCIIGYDFHSIFSGMKLSKKKVSEKKRKQSRQFFEAFYRLLERHLPYLPSGMKNTNTQCGCPCICPHCEPDDCQCDDCFGYTISAQDLGL